MKRVERLFQLMLLMREGNVLTGQHLSKELGVSTRTVYRDIDDLVDSGVPIVGESGVGFILRDEHRLPTVIFTDDELRALALGAEMVRMWSDRGLGNASKTAIQKIETVLPGYLKANIRLNGIEVHGVQMSEDESEKLKIVRASLQAGEKLALSYSNPEDVVTHRIIRPLLLSCWSGIWSVGAWCELRDGFRTFRVDRIVRVKRTTEPFEQTAECSHHAYLTCQTTHHFFREQKSSRRHDELTPFDETQSPTPTNTTFELRREPQ